MKRSKVFVSFFVAILIMAFTITTVGAQVEPPVPENREPPGETDLSGYTELPGNYIPDGGPITVDQAFPLSPIGNYVYTRRPTFYFASQPGATKYQIEVWSWEKTETLYTYDILTPNCPSYYCVVTPPTKLTVRYDNVDSDNIGRYDWRVRAYTTGWQAWSGYTEPDFYVLSKGFNNDFSTEPSKWWKSSGPWWWNQPKGRIDSNGTYAGYSNVYHQEAFVNFDYSVKMKRPSGDHTNAIWIWGNPLPNTGDGFYDGIYFTYINSGEWGVYKRVDGAWVTPLQTFTYNPTAINEYGSNLLRVRAVYPYMDFWINGVYLGWYADNTLAVDDLLANTVGFDAYGVSPSEPLRVTSAVLTVLKTEFLSVQEHDPAMQLGLNPVDSLDPNPAESVDPNEARP